MLLTLNLNKNEESNMKALNKTVYPVIIAISIPLLILGGCAGDERVKLAPDTQWPVSEVIEQSDDFNQQQAIDGLVAELPEQSHIEVVESAIDVAIEENEADKTVIAKPDDSVISFAFDRSDIDAQYGELLWQHAQYLKENKNLILNISGHTDDSGARVYNEILSKKRAEQVASILIEFGVPVDRIKISGYANDLPLAEAAHHREHRRVELDYHDQQMVSSQ